MTEQEKAEKAAEKAEERKWQAAKDGCNYCLDLSKQFLTLASAGLAFVVGVVTTEAGRPPLWITVLALLCFCGSVFFGLVFHMKITGNVAGKEVPNYDPFDSSLTNLAMIQMALFAAAVVLLGCLTVGKTVGWFEGDPKARSLEIRTGKTAITVPLTEATAINFSIDSNRVVKIDFNGVVRTNPP